ncbi:MAG TPA: hypothetical protein VFA98_08970 [Thermoanaerobaculia bacterium]|nr:hypothetical protein [Thermoanaerobaculia bacterium]
MKPSQELALHRLRQNLAETLNCVQCDSNEQRVRELGAWLDEFTPNLSSDRAKKIATLLRDRAEAWSQTTRPGSLPRVARELQDAADAFLITIEVEAPGGGKPKTAGAARHGA